MMEEIVTMMTTMMRDYYNDEKDYYNDDYNDEREFYNDHYIGKRDYYNDNKRKLKYS